MIKDINMLVCVPSNRDWKAQFGIRMIDLSAAMFTGQICHGYNFMMNSSLLPASRQKSLQAAQGHGFSHALMIDDDMNFAPQAVISLIETLGQDRRLSMICANYISKGPGGKPCVRGLDDKPLRSAGKSGYEEISQAGLGLALLDLSCLKHIDLPWFEVPYLETEHLGEDYYFCRLLRHNGFKIAVDHTATQYVSHIGDHYFTEKDLEMEKSDVEPPRYL